MPLYAPWLPPCDNSDIDYPVAYPDIHYEQDMARIMAAVERGFLSMQEKCPLVAAKLIPVRKIQVHNPPPVAPDKPPTPSKGPIDI